MAMQIDLLAITLFTIHFSRSYTNVFRYNLFPGSAPQLSGLYQKLLCTCMPLFAKPWLSTRHLVMAIFMSTCQK